MRRPENGPKKKKNDTNRTEIWHEHFFLHWKRHDIDENTYRYYLQKKHQKRHQKDAKMSQKTMQQ